MTPLIVPVLNSSEVIMRAQIVLAVMMMGAGAAGCSPHPGGHDDDAGADAARPDAADAAPEDGGAGPAPTPCTEEALAGGCTVGHCRLTAPRGTVPPGTAVLLSETAPPSALTSDALGTAFCEVTLPAAGIRKELDLAITLDCASDPAAALFQYEASGGSALVTTSMALAHGAVANIAASGTYGLTKRSDSWHVAEYAGVDVDSSATPADVLRNISSRGFWAGFWDGTHLFVGNGPRVLVYNGMPASPTQLPDVVLGQLDLNTTSTITSSSVFRGVVTGIWSNGTKLVVATGNRVLIWSTMPTASFKPADVVLGQPDFSSDVANNGGVSASSLYFPSQISSDGTRLAVADSLNNRVLVWDEFPTSNGQPATSVIGQGDFTSAASLAGAVPLYQTWGVALAGAGMWLTSNFGVGLAHVAQASAINPVADFSPTGHFAYALPWTNYAPGGIALLSNGSMAVRDYGLLRAGMYRSAPAKEATPYDFTLGQPDLLRQVSAPVDGSSFGVQPYGLGSGGSRVLLPDGNRLLVFDAPTYNYEPASMVIGQAGFGANVPADYRGIGAGTLAAPAGVAVSGSTVAIADRGNNRVVLYDKGALTSRPAFAKVIVGQPDARSFVANGNVTTPSAARLSGPAGVALDATHLIVTDTENHRVLIWSPVPTVTGTAASVVLGQADFAGRRPNHGRIDASAVDGSLNADATGMFYPTGVATDGTHLVVADRLNHRVLLWNAIPTTNDAPADAVIGQSALTASRPNHGAGPGALRADGFDLPSDVAISGTTLFVADTENNRVVRIADAFTAPAPAAWIGQPDGTTLANPNWGINGGVGATNPGLARQNATTSASVLRPRGIAVTSTALYVTERDSNRVHVFDPATMAPLAVLGQPNMTSATANLNGVSGASLSGPLGLATDGATLFVADADNHRVLGWGAASRPPTGAAASIVIGQFTELANGFNQSSTASGSATSKPRGLSRAGADLYVADTAHHRVLVLGAPPHAGDAPKRVFGQPDADLALPNAGGAPSARSLRSPRGVFADARHAIVADTGNHRVLVFDPTTQSPDAVIVLGQTTFTAALPNAGAAPTLASLASPEGVYFDGVRLYVADTGNHRVLVWRAMPTQNGQAADFVLGQSAGDQVLSNRGGSAAAADTMASPTAIDVIGGALFVADAGNNRVLRWGALPAVSGAPASSTLGQSDLTSRTSASGAADTRHLAGPVALAHDQANLYVTDRDAGRVVVFSLPATATGAPVARVLGALGGLNIAGPAGIAVDSTPYFTSRLYIADTNDERLVVVDAVSRLLE